MAIVTPFHEDGSINYDKFEQLVNEQIEGGTDAIIVCGTTGEASTLTHEEHLDLIRFCVEKVNGRVPVIAGTGSNCTKTAVYLSTEAEKYGVDGLLLVTPYYNKATQNGLFAHFKTIADAVKLPVILYNVPGRTGCNLMPKTVARLCTEVSNIVAIKEASGNLGQVVKLMALADGKLDLYSNVAPRQVHDICQKFFDGDVEGSMKEQLRAIELCDALFCEVNPIPVKEALNLMGKEVGPTHMPLSKMEPEHVEVLKTAMQNYGIL